ncbi:OLC1v1027438C1 [Oldenlandia corymbosa var. corymbosa]|uniref:OLC1v1027438C1 n=1 Tax=Oldenlandia corymbosa var. corymbosa TaxID=529605 RepID=A0AAV1C9H0_OLDCO|nr:OLC1v1027438C1 [Oldenlandia corymbosa var. corymbosa]
MPASQASIELPILDISQPLSPSSLSSLSVACREWGFFLLCNHGISTELHKKVQSLSSRIFMLPPEVKLQAGHSLYTPHFIASPFYECIKVSGPNFFASAQSSSEAILNEPYSDFCDTLQEYGSIMTKLSKRIVEILLMCLGEDGSGRKLSSEFDKCEGYFRINNYSSLETDYQSKKLLREEDEVECLGMHTDMSSITIVYQDEMGGLQVRSKEGKWMDVNPRKGNILVVNIGDLMQAWSNGKLRSSEHRVVLRRRPKRYSVSFFWSFEEEKVIFAPDEIVGRGNLRLYRPFLCADYMRYRENSEKGKFEKVGYTVQHFAGINN